MSDGREHRFLKWLLDLSTHAVWRTIEEIPKYFGTIFSLLIVLRQWLRHAYGLLFILALCTFALALLYIGLRRIHARRNPAASNEPARELSTEPRNKPTTNPTPAEATEKTSSLIYCPTLEEIKEYDPKLKKLGRTVGLVIVAICAALVWAHPEDEVGDFPPSHHSDYPTAPLQFPWAFILLSLTFLVVFVAVFVALMIESVAWIRR